MSAEKTKLTMESRIRELYATSVGHDTVRKVLLQMNIPEAVITNPVVSNLKLKTLAGITKKMFDRVYSMPSWN